MAEFPPNLDDGEMWLPSDIFLTDAAAAPTSKLNPRSRFSPLDELSWSLSAPSLLPTDHQEPPPPPGLPQRFKWWIRLVQYSSVSESQFVRCVGPMECHAAPYNKYGHRNIPSNDASQNCCYQCHLLQQAVQSQVNGFGETALSLQRWPQQRPFQNHLLLLPNNYQERRTPSSLGGGGTGVFLPRFAQTTPSASPPCLPPQFQFKRKQGPRNEPNVQKNKKMNSISTVDAGMKKEEMVLPHDWTY